MAVSPSTRNLVAIKRVIYDEFNDLGRVYACRHVGGGFIESLYSVLSSYTNTSQSTNPLH